MILPCLSIRQPWPWLILHGGKNIENRGWNTNVRGTILLHASKGFTHEEYDAALAFVEDFVDEEFAERMPSPSELKFGGIVGAVRLVDVVRPGEDGGPWHTGQWGFRLEKPTALPFRAYRGALGFFRVELTADEERVLREAGLVCS